MSPLPQSKAMSIVLEVKLGTQTDPRCQFAPEEEMERKQESSWDPGRGLQTVAGQWRCGVGGGGVGPLWQSMAACPPTPGPVPCWPLAFDTACAPPPTCWSPTLQWLRVAAHVVMAPQKERMPQGRTYC